MKVKALKPVTPGQRGRVVIVGDNLTKKRPEKKLTVPNKSTGARSKGRITVRGRGGGHKRLYRIIDFIRREKQNMLAEVIALEYDPNRSCNIALISYADNEKRYIIAPEGLEIGTKVESGENVKVAVGNAMPLRLVPVGTHVHNVELHLGQGGKMVRSAGQ